MKKLLLVCGITAMLLMGTDPIQAKIEWSQVKHLALDEKPIDIAASSDGASVYILTKKNILVYSIKDGRILDTMPLEQKFTSIEIAPKSNTLLLASASGKTVSIRTLSETIELPIGASPVIGAPAAPVTLTAFMDFQCPYCSREFPVLEQLLKKYPNDLKVIIKHFPLRSHKFAAEAAVAALAADKQGKYLELTRILMKNFRSLNEETLKTYAEEVGVDLEKLQQDRQDSAHSQQIKNDRQLARKAGVRGVPSLYINGLPVKNRSLQGMAAMIDQELKKK